MKRHKRAAHPDATGQTHTVSAAERARPEAATRQAAVRAAVDAQPGATIRELAEASRLSPQSAQGCVARLLALRQLLPVPLPDGSFGYRLPSQPVEMVEERLGRAVPPPPAVRPVTIEDLGRLLVEAGLPAVVRDETTLVVAGQSVNPPRSVLDDPEAATRWYESYVLEHHGELLADRTRRQFDNLAPMLATHPGNAGVVVLDGRPERAALVTPTQAVLRTARSCPATT